MPFLNLLLQPFKKNISLTIFLFFIITCIDIYDLINRNCFSYLIYMLFHGYVISYILCLIYTFLHKKIKPLYIIITTCFILFFNLADFFCLTVYHQRFSQKFAIIIMQTNFNEAKEFIETYIPLKYYLYIFYILSTFSLIFFTLKRIMPNKKKFANWGIFLVFVGILMTIRNPMIIKDGLIGKIITTFSIPTIPDLRNHLTYPDIIFTRNKQPQNVIMIIGESFSKSHSSLYNYKKTTNPLLSSLVSDSTLFVFNNVKSPSTGTASSFQAFMGTYKTEYQDSIPWYSCTTIPEILQNSNYYTYWISNQSKIGLYDTVVGKYADLCNKQFFVGDKYAGGDRFDYDESLIPIIETVISNQTKANKFFFIHLMGSHTKFEERYPKHFQKYTPSDYTNYPEHQRQNLAAYDNSILYNDSVVYEIIKLFHKQQSIIIYFSDHAIDVYESDSNFIGHARGNDLHSVYFGSNIPFMIYTSPSYKTEFPEIMKHIQSNLNTHYNTDDIIYTIMDIIGVQIKFEINNEKSILNLSNP